MWRLGMGIIAAITILISTGILVWVNINCLNKEQKSKYLRVIWSAWGLAVIGFWLGIINGVINFHSENTTINLQVIPTTTSYDLLRDITLIELAIIALLAAIIGVGLFYLLRDRLTKDITNKMKVLVDESCNRIQARANIHDGVIHWIGGMHERAFKLTQIGLELGAGLLDEPEVIMAKSNCGYYLAEDHQKKSLPHLKRKAIELVLTGYEKYDQLKDKYNRTDWIDNYIFVRTRFCETKLEQKEIVELINELSARNDLKDIREFLIDSKNYVVNLNGLT
jgi:hypothetical protein